MSIIIIQLEAAIPIQQRYILMKGYNTNANFDNPDFHTIKGNNANPIAIHSNELIQRQCILMTVHNVNANINDPFLIIIWQLIRPWKCGKQ